MGNESAAVASFPPNSAAMAQCSIQLCPIQACLERQFDARHALTFARVWLSADIHLPTSLSASPLLPGKPGLAWRTASGSLLELSVGSLALSSPGAPELEPTPEELSTATARN